MAARDSYDEIAADYAKKFLDELAAKPIDRALLDLVAGEVGDQGVIADIGCGPGHVARYLHDRGAAVLGIDVSPAMIEVAGQAHPGIEFRVGDMGSLEFSDQSWAGIVAMYSIIHIPPSDLAGVAAEFQRVLRPGGMVLLAFHVGDETRHVEEMLGHAVDLDFYFYGRELLEQKFEEAGFALSGYVERPPYPREVATTRGYLLARRT